RDRDDADEGRVGLVPDLESGRDEAAEQAVPDQGQKDVGVEQQAEGGYQLILRSSSSICSSDSSPGHLTPIAAPARGRGVGSSTGRGEVKSIGRGVSAHSAGSPSPPRTRSASIRCSRPSWSQTPMPPTTTRWPNSGPNASMSPSTSTHGTVRPSSR